MPLPGVPVALLSSSAEFRLSLVCDVLSWQKQLIGDGFHVPGSSTLPVLCWGSTNGPVRADDLSMMVLLLLLLPWFIERMSGCTASSVGQWGGLLPLWSLTPPTPQPMGNALCGG